MPGKQSHSDILNALEKSFDYYSARNLVREALKVAGVGEKKNYSDEELALLSNAFIGLVDEQRFSSIAEHLGLSMGSGSIDGGPGSTQATAAEAETEAKAEAVPVEANVIEEKSVEPAPVEAVVETSSEEGVGGAGEVEPADEEAQADGDPEGEDSSGADDGATKAKGGKKKKKK